MHITAERVSHLHERELVNFMDEIKHTIRPSEPDEATIINEAVSLVRSGKVNSYKYDDLNDVVVARLEDNAYTILLNFKDLHVICDCCPHNWCSHNIAIVFHLFSQFHSLSDWLHEWKRTETDQMAFKISDRTPAAWNDVLSRLMNPIRTIGFMENPAVFIHKFSIIEQNRTSLIPFEWEWRPLFDVYFRWHALEAAWPYIAVHLGDDETSFAYGKWYVKNWLSEQLAILNDSVLSIASKPRLFETDPFYEQLKMMTRSFTLEKAGLFHQRFRVFQIFWQGLFTSMSLQNEEITYLEKEDALISPILIAFFYVLQDDNKALEQLTDDVNEENFVHWLPLAHIADQDDALDSLGVIMRALLPFIGDYITNFVPLSRRPSFVRKIDGYLESANFPEEEREKMFSYYGETGVDVYADFLVERERFHEWAALMHRYNVPYDIAEAGGLKVALANDAAAVLPLLHLYAMNFIAERSRQSYRRAVNVFKKMKMGAKKCGKQDFWNRYVATVREKNRRLRALMEEMEKGNLDL